MIQRALSIGLLYFAGALLTTALSSPTRSMAPGKLPGKMVDIGGYRLHIHCVGQGLPTIIFDSGTGGFSLEWSRVQTVLARKTKVCAYDRAGYGWSDMGPLPRTSERITKELHTLLNNGDIAGPYILAGHSFGGYTAQLFAKSYPEEMAGLVLIDSSHPEQVVRLPRREREHPRTDIHRSRSYIVSRAILHPNFPDETMVLANRMINSWNHTMTWREEMIGFPLSARQILASEAMPDIPVVVLTRGQRVWPNNDYGDEMERVWMELQDELSHLGSNQVHLIAERSGHFIHLDQPEIVIGAMQTFLNANFPRKQAGK